MRTFFTSMSRSYLRRDKPCYLTGDASAAALWAAPGTSAMTLSQVILEAAPNGLAFGRRLFRALRTQQQIEHLHAGQSAPHWYLGYLGTRRDRQGQGLGTQMLQEVLAGADADGVPAYLESSNERNLPLYERNGLRVVGELPALGHGPTIWHMWRDPLALHLSRRTVLPPCCLPCRESVYLAQARLDLLGSIAPCGAHG